MHTYGLSLTETAEIFLVDGQTVARWQREATAESEKNSVGTLVRADPPLRAFDDVVKRLVLMLDSFGIGGSKKIAQMLARAGVKIGRETVRNHWARILRRAGLIDAEDPKQTPRITTKASYYRE